MHITDGNTGWAGLVPPKTTRAWLLISVDPRDLCRGRGAKRAGSRGRSVKFVCSWPSRAFPGMELDSGGVG